MNYLAHFYLAGESQSLITGNFIADFVKGRKYQDYPPEIAKGILMHREIDHFTDHHPIVMETKKRLYPAYRKYAPVIVDIYYDHMLAANWKAHAGSDLKSYTRGIYHVLTSVQYTLPPAAQLTLSYMVRYDWLYNYATLEGIDRALSGLSRRTRFESNIEKSIRELRQDYDQIKDEFQAFLPEIEQHLRSFQTH